jgi:hypothetical protein
MSLFVELVCGVAFSRNLFGTAADGSVLDCYGWNPGLVMVEINIQTMTEASSVFPLGIADAYFVYRNSASPHTEVLGANNSLSRALTHPCACE